MQMHFSKRQLRSSYTAWRSVWAGVCVVLIFCTLLAQAQQTTDHSRQPARTAPQVKQVLPSYEGQNVASVEIAGQPDVTFATVQQLIAQKQGEPFAQAKIDQTIAALKSSGRFNDVQLQVIPDISGVRVLFILQPGMYFGMYQFPGAVQRYSYSRLLQVTNYPPEGPYSQFDIERSKDALLKFFQRSGYFTATVEPQIETVAQYGIVNVNFNTKLGKRAKFGKVDIQGPTQQETLRLHDKITTSILARLRGSAIRAGKTYSPRTLDSARQYLENALAKEDRLNAQVKLVGAAYDPESNRADITFHVEEGPLVRVKVEGAHVWSWTRKKLLPVYQEVGVDEEIIQEGKNNLVSHFQSKGYFDSQVAVNVQQQKDGESIVYTITKGPRHKVERVAVAGNQTLRSEELLPHVTVEKEHFLSHGKYSDKLVRASAKNLEGVYRAAGFSAVKVQPEVKREGDDLNVVFRVTEGPRDVVQTLTLAGNATLPVEQIAPHGLKVVAGQPYSQKLVDDDRNQVMARYLQLGYLTATFRSTAKAVNKGSHEVRVVYQIYEGPQVTTNNIITLGAKATRQSYIDLTTRLWKNTPMSEGDMLAAESNLYTPGIFDWAEVDPRRQITTQNREDIVVKVHEAKRNQLTYGFGFEVINRGGSVPSGTVAVPGLPPIGLNKDFQTSQKTFYGPRGTFEYTRKNFRGKAETLSVGAIAGRLNQRGTFTWQNPNFRSTSWATNFTASAEHSSENPIFTSRNGDAGFQFQKNLDAKKTQNLFLRYNFRETRLSKLLIPALIPAEDLRVRLSTLSATYIRDTRDNSLDAHKGIYQSYEFGLNPSFLGSSVDFSRFLGQTAYYKRIPANIVWANSIRLGLEGAFGDSHVPISEKFFSGGGSTLRGFPLNGAGPQNTISACGSSGCFPITVPVGGTELFIINSEFRIPVPFRKGLGVVGFYDGGNVFQKLGLTGQYTNTLGFGIRYATPVGPVRVDIGHNMNAPVGVKSTQIFITLGQAF